MGIYAILIVGIVVGVIGWWYEDCFAKAYTDIPQAIAICSGIVLAFALLITGMHKGSMFVEQDYMSFMEQRNSIATELNTCPEEDLNEAICSANEFNSLIKRRQNQLHNRFVDAFVSPAWDRIPLLDVGEGEIKPVEVTRWQTNENLNTD